MSEPDPRLPKAAADLAAAIARLAAELSLGEEPSGFVAALDSDPHALDAPEPE